MDAKSFFLAPDGKTDPEAELEATFKTIFGGNDPEEQKRAICTFPARYRWLQRIFNPEEAPLEPPCDPYRQWVWDLQPFRLTLVFPAAYLNNPASMFGHTLLRIDARDQDDQTRLLAQTVNYAADSRGQHGFLYAFNGLFGGYRGRFSMAPYYVKVKAYGDIENRDIWEYSLNLSEEEIEQLLAHLWEMRSAWFDYYFLDENCSYHLLSLLETARPKERLLDRFDWWAVPSETVRSLAEAELVGEVRFRPSRTTILQERAWRMDGNLQSLSKDLTTGRLGSDAAEIRSLDPVDQAQVLELAIDYAAYLRNIKAREAPLAAANLPGLLHARSRLKVPNQTPELPAPHVWPGKGHQPARVDLGYGFEDDRHFISLSGGPGYHDIFDPQGGFTKGAQVIALQGELRYYPEKNRIELERFDILDILSLSPWNRFLHPVSWKLALGLRRKHREASDRLLLGAVDTGFGIHRELSPRTSAHLFAEGTLEVSDRLENFAAPGIGPGIGLMHDFSDEWRSGLFGQARYFPLDESRIDLEITARNRLVFDNGNMVGLDLSWKRQFDRGFFAGTLYLRWFF